jgi:hypothetical protein
MIYPGLRLKRQDEVSVTSEVVRNSVLPEPSLVALNRANNRRKRVLLQMDESFFGMVKKALRLYSKYYLMNHFLLCKNTQ